jgi:cytochrome c oxidase assembly protein subunit 11
MSKAETPRKPAPGARSHRAIALSCAVLVAAMVGAAYAAVPLYNIFCRATGFDGTTQVATKAPDHAIARKVRVSFDANVAPGLTWTFKPEVTEVEIPLGETRMVDFVAHNYGDTPMTGIASYNVTPETTGAYFDKIQCFCFSKQTLQPGQTVEMPVVFFVDPAITEDKTLDWVTAITLSYTFFGAKEPAKPVADAGARTPNL